MRGKPVGDLLVLVLAPFSLQKVAVAAHPREGLAATVRTARNELGGDARVVALRLDHLAHGLHGIPGVVCAAARALEEAVVALDLRHLVLRVELHELRVLVGGEHEEVLALEQGVEVEVGRAYRRRLRGVKKRGEIRPLILGRLPPAKAPVEGAANAVLLGKLAEVLAKGRRVPVVEVAAARRREPGRTAHENAVGPVDLANQPLDLLLVRERRGPRQLVGRTARRIRGVEAAEVLLRGNDQLLVRGHRSSSRAPRSAHILSITSAMSAHTVSERSPSWRDSPTFPTLTRR